MARRLAAALALVAIVALALTLLWRVYGHHVQNGTFEDAPALVERKVTAPWQAKFTVEPS